MMKRVQRGAILVIALILLHLAGFSQDQKYVKKNLAFVDSSAKINELALPIKQAPAQTRPTPYPLPLTPVSMGFFCRQEYKLEKSVRMPIKIRLGTFEEARRLEYGK